MTPSAGVSEHMTVMVVGGAGFLGSHVVDRFLADGSSVDVVDDLSTGSLSNLSSARSSASEGALRIHTVDATIAEFAEIVRSTRPDVLFVSALLTGSSAEGASAVKSFALAASVLNAALKARVSKVVVTLPAAVLYGDVAARDLPIKEDREHYPVGINGVVAQAIIELLEMYRRDHGIEFTILAVATIYGPRQKPQNNVVSRFIQAHHSSELPVIHGDGKQTRDFLYVDDAVDAASRACTKGDGLLLHVGSGLQTSIKDLWALIGENAPATLDAKANRGVQRMSLSGSRARLHLGWSPWTSLSDGLSATTQAVKRP